MSRNSKMKEKQNWASEKPKLESARRLRGIYFIEPGDEEFKEIIKNARKIWKFQQRLQCLAKRRKGSKYGATRNTNDDHR